MRSPRFDIHILFLALLLICIISAPACTMDEGGDSSDSSAADDDDVAQDDDDNDNNDDDDDNDDNNDDNDDNDDDDTTDVLLIIGLDEDEMTASWLGGPGDWTRYELPSTETEAMEGYHLSRTVAVDGRYVYGALNVTGQFGGAMAQSSWSVRHEWVQFDRRNGWQKRESQPPTADGHVIDFIGYDLQGRLWADSQEYFHYDTWGWPEQHVNRKYEGLYRYIGDTVANIVSIEKNSFESFWISDFGPGLACERSYLGFPSWLWEFDGETWSSGLMPAGFLTGYLSGVVMTAPGEAYAVVVDNDGNRDVVEKSGNSWTRVPLPDNCETSLGSFWPSRITGTSAHVISWDPNHYYDQFMEKTDGQWRCRSIPSDGDSARVHGAVSYADGRAFVIVTSDVYGNQLMEVLPDELVPVDLPLDLQSVSRVHVLGPGAPARHLANW